MLQSMRQSLSYPYHFELTNTNCDNLNLTLSKRKRVQGALPPSSTSVQFLVPYGRSLPTKCFCLFQKAIVTIFSINSNIRYSNAIFFLLFIGSECQTMDSCLYSSHQAKVKISCRAKLCSIRKQKKFTNKCSAHCPKGSFEI